MLLGWFRAETVVAIQPGDVRFVVDGSLLVVVWSMKGRPQLLCEPGLMQVPLAARPDHPRSLVFAVEA